MLDWVTFLPADGPQLPHQEHASASRTGSGRTRLRVLVVDDERLIADTVGAILNGNGFEAISVYNGEQAMEAARQSRPDVVLSDVLMPRMSGVELAVKLRQEFADLRIFLFSGQAATSELMRQAQAEGYHFELFPKPIHPDELISRLRQI